MSKGGHSSHFTKDFLYLLSPQDEFLNLFVFPCKSPFANPVSDKLLRLRKNLATTLPCAVSQKNWLRLIVPMFGAEQLVDQCLVQLRPARVIERLNKELLDSQKSKHPSKGPLPAADARPIKRHGIFLADDDHGLLVTDMTPGKRKPLFTIYFLT